MHTGPSEASLLREVLKKEEASNSYLKEKLEEVVEAVRAAEMTILKNRKLNVDLQILAFGDLLSKIKEIALK